MMLGERSMKMKAPKKPKAPRGRINRRPPRVSLATHLNKAYRTWYQSLFDPTTGQQRWSSDLNAEWQAFWRQWKDDHNIE